MKRLTSSFWGLFLGAALALPALADHHDDHEAAWPTFQHNAQRTGHVKRPEISNPAVRWRARVGVTGWLNNPIIAHNTVFIGSSGYLWNQGDAAIPPSSRRNRQTDGVYAFDVKTGVQKWYTPAADDVNQIMYTEHQIIATGDEKAVWALDPETGLQRWITPLDGEGYQLLSVGKEIVVGDSTGKITWLDATTGKRLAQQQLDGAIRSGASASGTQVFTATTQGTVYAFDAKHKQKWKTSLRDVYPELISQYMPQLEIYGAPTLYDGAVVIGFARDTTYPTPALVALEKNTGKLRWKGSSNRGNTSWGNVRTSPALVGERLIYAEAYSNSIVSLQSDTGAYEGRQYAGAMMFPQWSSPAVAGQTAYVPRFDGGLYAIDTEKGDLRWQLYLGIPENVSRTLPVALKNARYGMWKPRGGDAIYNSPAIDHDGAIFIAAAGYLYCIEQSK